VPVHRERQRGEEGAFHTVRSVSPKRDQRRGTRVAAGLPVDWNLVQEILNLAWRVELSKDGEFWVRLSAGLDPVRESCAHEAQYRSVVAAAAGDRGTKSR
jgi:hypothetical protein